MTKENSTKADAAKSNGNQCFKDKDFAGAVKFFSEAIELEPENEVHYSNRSLAHLKSGSHDAALGDAVKCIELKPEWGKGYSRKGACLLLMKETAKAIACYEAGLELDPQNKVLADGLATAHKALAGGKKKKKKKKGKKGKAVAAAAGEEGEEKGEEKEESYVIGIDLGTTYSCVGVFINDKVRILENKNGQKTLPSYVCFDPNGERSCGHAAKNQSTRLPKNVIYDVKRIIGQRYKDNGVKDDIKKMMYDVIEDEEGKPMIKVQMGEGEEETKLFAPEEISAMVLSYCKELAEDVLKVPVTRAVVTVPAYFNDSQRQATKTAGSIAGLDVLRIINEPTAAALSYGLDNKVAEGKPLNILIFDLGGGTFDVSILTIEGGLFTVKATGGDTRLGGEDFDNNLIDYILQETDKQGIPDPKEHPRAMQRLRKAAENCKRELSSAQSSEIRLDAFVTSKFNFKLKVTRAKFEALNKGPFLLCIDTVSRVLKDAKLKNTDIDEIVLVGGSTRIPKLQDMLVAEFDGKALCKSLNPDEAVAYGAAIQGAVLSGKRSTKTDNLLLMDITPLSLGIETTGNVMSVVIPRNTPIPCIKTQTYTTDHDYQTEDTVPVYEGERMRADENNLLGEFTITGIERAKKGEPSIAVSFAIDSDGILNVTAIDQKTKAKADITIANRSRATTDQIDHMVAEAAKYKVEDEERLRKVEAKNQLEESIYECLDVASQTKDQKLAGILKEAAEKEQVWLDAEFEAAKTSEIALRRRALARRLDGKSR